MSLIQKGLLLACVLLAGGLQQARGAELGTQGVLLDRVARGESVALVSDAGTPLVSDPGAGLVRAARSRGLRVEAVPGPSAVLAALTASGLPCETFTFLGFVPPRASERRQWLTRVAAEPHTVVCFEAPHRIRDTLVAIVDIFGERQISLARELTKLHEQVLTGSATDVLEALGEERGECTLVIAPDTGSDAGTSQELSDRHAWLDFRQLTEKEGFGRREAVTALARRYGRSANDVYSAIERGKAEG